MQILTAEMNTDRCRSHQYEMYCKISNTLPKSMAEYSLDMLADTGPVLQFSKKRKPMISGHALTDAINENSKRGKDDISGRYSDIPGKMS